MATSPLDYRSERAKLEACVRLETQFEAAIGEIDERSVHVEVNSRWKPNALGETEFSQIVSDADIARVVEDVNALGNVSILDLTENDITDAAVVHLTRLKSVSELWLTGTKITSNGIAKLVEALPYAKIVHGQTRSCT